ncbi:hypothetical protein GFH48_12765 [Streptomyces fagopyri]|uniref:Uncharacterized protein n=1 Tax=Streptomyces fagopyri TaxID=2662397 RepID=A0A5Q0LAQ3_9ACTN|nr:hypothetical protein [Streptomyces fagopyri]QFZ74001.1 hypothetical protein GFH48_12765 [Streptomyces fagopyri]
MIDVKGTPWAVNISGDREHPFAMPRDLAMLPPKVAAAYEKVVAAQKAEAKGPAKNGNNFVAMKETNDAVRAALGELYDVAASTSQAARQQYAEAFEYGVRRYVRALADAQSALQDVATAAALYDQAAHGHGVGLNPVSTMKAAMTARSLSESLESLPAVPELEA